MTLNTLIITTTNHNTNDKCLWKTNGVFECQGQPSKANGIVITSTSDDVDSFSKINVSNIGEQRKRTYYNAKSVWKLGAGYTIKSFESCSNATKHVIASALFSEWSNYFLKQDGIRNTEGLIGFFLKNKTDNPLYVMLDQDKKFVGTIAIDHTAPLHVLAVPSINHLYITSDKRQSGYGKTLMRWAEKHVSSMGFSLASLWCYPDMEAFYTRIGWRRIKVTSSTSTGETVVIMGKHV